MVETATSIEIRPLRKRADFLRLRRPERLDGYFYRSSAFFLQAAPLFAEQNAAFLGLTATKKLGNAVTRNRIKRRLRAAAHDILPRYAKPGFAYVLIARPRAMSINYETLLDDLKAALVSPI